MRLRMLVLLAAATAACVLHAEEDPAKSGDPKPGEAKSGAGAEAKDERDETLYVFVLKSGERLKGSKFVDFGDVYSVKSADGSFKTLKKEDVERVLDPVRPPAPPEPAKRTPPAETAEAKTADPAKPPPKKPEPPPPPGGNARSAPAGVWILKDGRKYNANQAVEAGDDWMIQTMDGRMVKFRKSDVARVEK
ncbi:MAG: hypothetical protein KIS92_11140 [Planctomycetota bacterium]|nr:hypothetical protein [Planctomycetota bacterium]